MPKQGTAKPHVEELQRRLEAAGPEFAMHKQLLYSAHNLTNGGACDNDSLGEHLGLLTAVIVEDRIRHDNQCPLRARDAESIAEGGKVAAAVAIAQAYRPWVWPAAFACFSPFAPGVVTQVLAFFRG